MKRFSKLIIAALVLIAALSPTVASADFFDDGQQNYYTIYTPDNQVLTQIGGAVNVDDEYIAGNNKQYVIYNVDSENYKAWARELQTTAFIPLANKNDKQGAIGGGSKRKIALYCTHSDESYLPSDGISSNEKSGSIYEVAESLSSALKEQGIETVQDYTTHLPHDSGAYRRSRSTAVELMKNMPDALIDIHRDGVPAEQYKGEIEGANEKDITKVRLLVGRGNPNSSVNKNFAQELKATADEMYPGLVKDIYIGKGNYNQELTPNSILLEFGTHETSKEAAQASTKYMAQVISKTLYGSANDQGGAAQGRSTTPREPVKGSSRGAWSGIWWILGIAIGGGLIFLLYSKGRKRFGHNVGRSVSELTGGLIGKKPNDEDKDEFDRP